MATVKEANLQGKDAAASVDTMAVMAVGDMFQGTITNVAGDKEDWVKVELKAGMTYSITLTGRKVDLNADGDTADTNEANTHAEDPILKLLDSKGGMIAMNDDINPRGDDSNTDTGDDTNLNSRLKFKAEEDGAYYISASSYTANPASDTSGAYTITVTELDLPVDIEGTASADKIVGTDSGESIMGKGGNDTIDGMGGDDEIEGNAGNDLITGGAGADEISGGDGEDTVSYRMSPAGVSVNLQSGKASGGDAAGDDLGDDIENVMGSMYDDMLVGVRRGERDNKLWGLDGDDDLSGDKGDDKLYGGAGDDMLDGGDDNDMLEGGAGMDTLTGGDGKEDTASWSGSMTGVTVRLHSGQIMGGDAEGDTWGDMVTVDYQLPDKDDPTKMVDYTESVPDIENLTGSHMADILAGDSRVNVLTGNGGDDKLYGGPGGGDDKLYGGPGNDSLYGGRDKDTLDGGKGDDILYGGHGIDTFYGGAGSDMIYADDDDTSISGAAAKDDPRKTTAFNEKTENARGEVDTVSYERVEPDKGVGVTKDLNTFISVENIIGTSGDDKLTGHNTTANVIEGGDGADELDAGGDDSTTDPGDTVSYENSDRGVIVDLDNGAGSQVASGGHAAGDTISNFENVTGSAHSDLLEGDNKQTGDDVGGGNVLRGLAGDDELFGRQGSDIIEGGAGADEMDGGTNGTDTTGKEGTFNDSDGNPRVFVDMLSYESSDAGVTVNLTTNTLSGGHAEGDEAAVQRGVYDHDDKTETDKLDVSTFEGVMGSDHNDRLTGDHRTNVLDGGKGDDTLRGMGGNDELIGGPGADMLDGGKSLSRGADTPNNPDDDVQHIDTVSYRKSMMGVTVDLDSGRGTAGDAEGDTYVSIEKFVGSGNDDVFIASEGKDNINGLGNTGDLTPTDATDDGIGDTVSYELSEVGVTIELAVQDGTTAQPQEVRDGDGNVTGNEGENLEGSYARGDVLSGFENVTGSPEPDIIKGDTNANILKGGAGDDALTGGNETGPGDTLEGGDGDDVLTGGDEATDDNPATRDGDTLRGGAGDDTLTGGGGDDILVGGTGSDTLDGGDGDDIYVFGPDKVTAGDYITDFDEPNETDNDKIDLSAFGIKADELPGLLSVRAGRVQIDLTGHGGGTIDLTTVNDIDDLDGVGGSTTSDDGADVLDGAFQYLDLNSDGDTADTGESNGVFIL